MSFLHLLKRRLPDHCVRALAAALLCAAATLLPVAPAAATRSWLGVSRDPASGVLRCVCPRRAQPQQGAPGDIALRFVRLHAQELGEAAQGAFRSAVGPRGYLTRQVLLTQTYGGVPVRGRHIAVNVAADGGIVSVENTTAPVRPVETRPRVSPLIAAAAIPGPLLEPPALWVDDDGAGPRLVWEFRKSNARGSATQATVDALTGELLRARDTAINAFGYGRVYEGNPVATPAAVIARLMYLDGSGWLTGTYARVYRFRNVIDTVLEGFQEAYDSRGVFMYLDEDSRMGQVQAYYGISRAHDYYRGSFGFSGRDSQMPAFTHWNGLENAMYMPDHPSGGAMAFGNGNGVDFSLDADVLFHEYFHAVTDVLNRSWTRAGDDAYEASGISEGMADYFSCTMQGEPVLGEYAGRAYGRECVRRLDCGNRFPEDVQVPVTMPDGQVAQSYPQIHHIGKIWGAACWDLRKAIGREAADRILFAAAGMFTAATRLQAGLVHVLAADATLYGGAHATAIRAAFAGHGITEAAYPVTFLPACSLAGEDGRGPRFGFIRAPMGQSFVEAFDYQPFGVYPSFVTGRLYALPGYCRDASIRSIFLVLRDARNRIVYRAGTDATPCLALSDGGDMIPVARFELRLAVPEALVPAGQTASSPLRLFVHTYSQPCSAVSAGFAAARPIAVTGGCRAQVIRSSAPVGG